MKYEFLTFQPKIYYDKLMEGKQVQAMQVIQSEHKLEQRLSEFLGFKPIWAIPLVGSNTDKVFNIARVWPSCPQVAIIFEKEFKDIRPVAYEEYSAVYKSLTTVSPRVAACLCEDVFPRVSEADFVDASLAYEVVVPFITPDEVKRVEFLTHTTDAEHTELAFNLYMHSQDIGIFTKTRRRHLRSEGLKDADSVDILKRLFDIKILGHKKQSLLAQKALAERYYEKCTVPF